MAKEEGKATVKGRLELGRLERAKLLYTMRLFRDAVEKAHHLKKRGGGRKGNKEVLVLDNTKYTLLRVSV